MVTTIPKLVYLFVAVCTSPSADDCQVYAMDSFEPGAAQMTDCREQLDLSADALKRKGFKVYADPKGRPLVALQAKDGRYSRMACKSMEQLQAEGI